MQSVSAKIKNTCVKADLRRAASPVSGIAGIKSENGLVTVTLEDLRSFSFCVPSWWFGTRSEYNSMSAEEKSAHTIHFIREGT